MNEADPLTQGITLVRNRQRQQPFLMSIFLILVVVDPLHARYLIAHKLSSGGYGQVYAGVRKKDGMPVALKVVPKKRVREINTVRTIAIR